VWLWADHISSNRRLVHGTRKGDDHRHRFECLCELGSRQIEDGVDSPNQQQLDITVLDLPDEICQLAIRTCGGQSMLKSLPLERLYRDSRCGSLMLPWTAEICLDRVGREALYEAGETDE